MNEDKKKNLTLGDLEKISEELFLESITGPDWLPALEALECKKTRYQ